MLKNIFAPVQTWLLAQNRCVGCSMPLSQAKKGQKNGRELVICKCKRVYIYEKGSNRYRRALLTEV